MAIVDHPGFPCWSAGHQLTPPPVAVAVIRRINSPDRPLEPRCQRCVDDLAAADAHYVVVYIDPTRQRRPQPDPDDPAVHHLVDGSCHHADCP